MKSLLYIFLLLVSLSFISCETDSYYESNDARLHFSVDTLTFDTVFTKSGSVTLNFKVYNTYSKDLRLSKILLSGSDLSPFRMNVDGVVGDEVNDMIIRKKDSMYIFVEVTIDPSDVRLPFVVNDSILFETNGNLQKVDLVAFGQNVNRMSITNDSEVVYIDKAKKIKALALSDMVFTNEVPYLIQDHICIDTLSSLSVDAGATIYLAKDVNIYVKGTLRILGTGEDRVLIRGDRLDQVYSGRSYDKVPGQWGGIYLMPGSNQNVIEYTDIRNGRIGIQLDSIVSDIPTLTISNSKISNMSTMAIYSLGSSIEADNCLFSNCGESILALTEGGKYLFNHCTIAGYYDWGVRNAPSLFITNFSRDAENNYILHELSRAEFNNCIIYGSNGYELSLNRHDDSEESQFSYLFNHCLLRVGRDFDTTSSSHLVHNIWNEQPKFLSVSDPFNFQPDSLSPVVGQADYNVASDYAFDLNNIDRLLDGKADIGAYEFVPKSSE